MSIASYQIHFSKPADLSLRPAEASLSFACETRVRESSRSNVVNVVQQIECEEKFARVPIHEIVKVFSIFSEIRSFPLLDSEESVGGFYAVTFHFCVKRCGIYRKHFGGGGLITVGFHQCPFDHSGFDRGHFFFKIDGVVRLSGAFLSQYFLERIDLAQEDQSKRAQGLEPCFGHNEIGDLGFLQNEIRARSHRYYLGLLMGGPRPARFVRHSRHPY